MVMRRRFGRCDAGRRANQPRTVAAIAAATATGMTMARRERVELPDGDGGRTARALALFDISDDSRARVLNRGSAALQGCPAAAGRPEGLRYRQPRDRNPDVPVSELEL